jgi:hypothetical protein
LADDNFELIEKTKDFEDLNVWQVVRFLYVIIEVGFRVLMGQATCTIMGIILSRIRVQFPCKLLQF